MRQLTINPNNRQYYSEDFIKGFNCGAQRQFETDKADRPQGEWIVHGEAPIYIKECSACGAKFFHHATEDLTPFCAMCGCRMKGASR